MEQAKNRSASLFPLAVVGVVAMMVVPLPSLVLDLLLSVNIAAAVLILLSSLNADRVLDLSSFPSVLLLATLFRLGLNVSTTRQILGSGQSGSVITSFGQSVVGGSLVVGLVVFFILVVIQFVVITNGSSRVSEVAARFTLDAMPGKQMAIDADLNAGLISDAEARRRRSEISREADFFGAMDGASKFVKGDAIAGLIITAVNLIGGLAIGMTSMGLSASEAAGKFALLTIGDGLVSQIPALLISTAAGIIVTRSTATESDLGSAVTGEFARQQRAFMLAGVAIAVLGALPGLPFVPFALVGVSLVAVSVRLRRSSSVVQQTVEDVLEPQVDPDDPSRLVHTMRVEPLELEIARDLVDLVDEASGGDLLDRIKGLRRKVALDLGVIMPPVRTRDNAALPFGTYRVLVHGVEAGSGSAPPGKVLVIDENLGRWPGEEITEPVFGLPAKWVSEAFKESVEGVGGTVVDRSAMITTHIGELVSRNAAQLLDRQQLKDLLDSVRETHPAVIDDLAASDIPMPTVQWVLRDLLANGVPVRDTARILEVLAVTYHTSKDPEVLAEAARTALGPAICAAYTTAGELSVINLDGTLEQELLAAFTSPSGSQRLDAQALQTVVGQIVDVNIRAQNTGAQPVLICSPQLRRPLASVFGQIPTAPRVLSVKEVGKSVKLRTVGTVTMPAHLSGADA